MTGLPDSKTLCEIQRFSEKSNYEAFVTLKKRKHFQAVSKGHRTFGNGLILQALPRNPSTGKEIRVGFTCSKKVGGAVVRNRAKRRLRAIAQMVIPRAGLDGWDYVLIGRAKNTVGLSFDQLKADLNQALVTMHMSAKP